MEAAIGGHLELAKLLIDKGADVNARDKGGRTALMEAALEGHFELAKLLIDKGADVYAKQKSGWTALMSAAASGDLAMVKLLLEKGAHINAKSGTPYCPFILQAVRPRDSHESHYSTVESYLAESENGWTALMSATAEGHVEVVRLLLEKYANVNARTDNGATALKIAQDKGRKDIVELLKAHGAKE